MAINVQYEPDPALVAQVSGQSGAAQYQLEQQARQQAISQFNQQQALRNAQFGESQHQFDVEAAQRQYSADQTARYQDQQAAAQQAHLQATMANDQAQREAEMARAQMGYDAQTQDTQAHIAAQMQGQQLQYAESSSQALEGQINAELAAARKMKFDPEGQRILNQLSSQQLQIRGLKGTLRPNEYGSIQGQWAQKWADSGLDGHQIQEPSMPERVAKQTWKDKDGAVWVFNEKRDLQYNKPEAPPKPTTIDLKNQEQERQRGMEFAQLPPDVSKGYLNEAHRQLLSEATPDADGNKSAPTQTQIEKKAKQNWDAARGIPTYGKEDYQDALKLPVGRKFHGPDGKLYIIDAPGSAHPL